MAHNLNLFNPGLLTKSETDSSNTNVSVQFCMMLKIYPTRTEITDKIETYSVKGCNFALVFYTVRVCKKLLPFPFRENILMPAVVL